MYYTLYRQKYWLACLYTTLNFNFNKKTIHRGQAGGQEAIPRRHKVQEDDLEAGSGRDNSLEAGNGEGGLGASDGKRAFEASDVVAGTLEVNQGTRRTLSGRRPGNLENPL
ncbi:hypothetical protein GOODEAATRI_021446 [Goodea atripinnis]|uniref:Uncharacterized protein n=1 Tax=Goodea atripinnis TaxID=208336 RepID=A0ABV0MU08_9TELE